MCWLEVDREEAGGPVIATLGFQQQQQQQLEPLHWCQTSRQLADTAAAAAAVMVCCLKLLLPAIALLAALGEEEEEEEVIGGSKVESNRMTRDFDVSQSSADSSYSSYSWSESERTNCIGGKLLLIRKSALLHLLVVISRQVFDNFPMVWNQVQIFPCRPLQILPPT